MGHFTGNTKAASFFSMIDNLFDIMNNSVPIPSSNKPLKAAFGGQKYYYDIKKNYVQSKMKFSNFLLK